MADRFYTPDAIPTGEFTLTGEEAHHLAVVRRFAVGDSLTLFNGDGAEYPATILGISKRNVTLLVDAPRIANRERASVLTIASALPKGDRNDFLIEKLTELGVTRFVPLLTARAVVQPKATVVEKFRRAVIEASKQCGRNRLMEVAAPVACAEFFARETEANRVVLHTGADCGALAARGNCVIAVGPEGGFTDAEIALALAHNWRTATLGSRVLRIETAAIAAAALHAE